jgi:hypothetical protein
MIKKPPLVDDERSVQVGYFTAYIKLFAMRCWDGKVNPWEKNHEVL